IRLQVRVGRQGVSADRLAEFPAQPFQFLRQRLFGLLPFLRAATIDRVEVGHHRAHLLRRGTHRLKRLDQFVGLAHAGFQFRNPLGRRRQFAESRRCLLVLDAERRDFLVGFVRLSLPRCCRVRLTTFGITFTLAFLLLRRRFTILEFVGRRFAVLRNRWFGRLATTFRLALGFRGGRRGSRLVILIHRRRRRNTLLQRLDLGCHFLFGAHTLHLLRYAARRGGGLRWRCRA